jgi:undecaprenyl-diphosphatase
LNPYSLAVLLGIIEGLTEFLPVSSTAHLRILEKLAADYHWADIDLSTGYWKMYTVVIQLGAILCLPVYFLPRILKLLSTFPRGERGDRNIINHPLSLTMIAFVVTAGPAYLLAKKIGENLDNFYVIGSALLIGGIVMWIVDAIFGERPSKHEGFDAVTAAIVDHGRLAPQPADGQPPRLQSVKTRHMEQMTVFQAIWIGACQTLSAVFPGTSRSMATIAAGQVAGMTRSAALEFSFFVSIPTMVAATGYDLLKSLRHPSTEGGSAIGAAPVGTHAWILLAIGFIVSFIVAYGVVAWFMRWVRTKGFVPFAMYRIIVGTCLIAYLLRRAG